MDGVRQAVGWEHLAEAEVGAEEGVFETDVVAAEGPAHGGGGEEMPGGEDAPD